MDYRALAELILMAFVGLSTLIFAIGFTVRLFLAPTLRELFDRLGHGKGEDQGILAERMDRLDERLEALEGGVFRLVAAQELDSQLVGSGDAAESKD